MIRFSAVRPSSLAFYVVLLGCHRPTEGGAPLVDASPPPDTSVATTTTTSAPSSAPDASIVDATPDTTPEVALAPRPKPVVASLTLEELTRRLAPFASGGGGKRFVVAIAASERGGAYAFHHWGGFWTTAALDDAVVTRPDPPLLLVSNHPYNRESKDQNVTEEIVRWRDDGTFVATGARYSKWDLGLSTEDFSKVAARLLVGTKR